MSEATHGVDPDGSSSAPEHALTVPHADDPGMAHDEVLALLAGPQGQRVAERDPVRWRYLQALTTRLHAQPVPVQAVLQARLKQAVAALVMVSEQGAAGVSNAVPGAGARSAGHPAAALGELNKYIRARAQPAEQPAMAHEEDQASRPAHEAHLPPMKSVRRFGETWARLAAEHQVEQALKRAPQNAGPLNSHMLVLRTFALMRGLSPDYLRHFLAQVDSLLWLDQVHRQYTLADGTGKDGRKKKAPLRAP